MMMVNLFAVSLAITDGVGLDAAATTGNLLEGAEIAVITETVLYAEMLITMFEIMSNHHHHIAE